MAWVSSPRRTPGIQRLAVHHPQSMNRSHSIDNTAQTGADYAASNDSTCALEEL
jgi:hypothetical protein